MKNNRFITLILTIVTMVICFSGCNGINKLEEMRVISVNVDNLTPDGMRGIKLDLSVGIDNPGVQVSLSEISCSFKHSGKVLGKVAVDPFTIHARTEEVYSMKANVSLSENTSLFDIGRLMNKAVLEEAVVDFSANVRLKSGVSRKLVYNDIPVKKLLEAAK
ncbi:MAG: hypothetical protein IJ971_08130 [Bacteroidales bacterium]|nr:hypothetical protein [Bacteroidales bacterium]